MSMRFRSKSAEDLPAQEITLTSQFSPLKTRRALTSLSAPQWLKRLVGEESKGNQEGARHQVFLWDHRREEALLGALLHHTEDELTMATNFEEIKSFPGLPKGTRISSIAFATDRVGVVTDKGEVSCYDILDSHQVVPVPLFKNLSGITITQLACGAQHWLFLTDTGNLWACGNNDDGQLGVGSHVDKAVAPMIVSAYSADSQKITVKSIAVGGRHSVALGTDGTVLCWGCSKNGRCGNGDKFGQKVMQPQPLRMEALKKRPDLRVSKIACGWSHSLLLLSRMDSDSAQVYSFGRGSSGQCGVGTTDDVYIPTLIKGLVSMKVVDICAGYYHTACLSQKGKVYTFGGGAEGQCGHGGTNNQTTPTLVSALEYLKISSIYCGSFITMAFYPGTSHMNPPPLFGSSVSRLYCWGKCGANKVQVPTEVKSMTDVNILSVVGGMYKTIAVVEVATTVPNEHKTLYEVLGLPFTDKFIGSYVCALDFYATTAISPVQGHIYLSDNNFSFYSKTFDDSTKITCNYSEILSLETSNTRMTIPNAIQIFITHKKFRFVGFANRDEVFGQLISLWNAHHKEELGFSSTKRDGFNDFTDLYKKYPVSGDKNRDVYGFRLEEEEMENYSTFVQKYIKTLDSRIFKWEQLLKQDFETQLHSKSKHLKKLTRQGIPPRFRGEVWYKMTGAEQKAKYSSNYYFHLTTSIPECSSATTIASIDQDIGRTMPDNPYFQDQGKETLRRLLIAYSIRNPSVGYCQSMNFIAGVLLLFTTEEKAFWILSAIVEEILPEYFTKSMIGILVDHQIFEIQLSKRFPNICGYLDDLSFPTSAITFKWFICLYFGSMPTETALQMWDWFFLEGFSVLFLTSAAIFKLSAKEIAQCDQVEISFLLKSSPRKFFDAETLMQQALDITGFFDEAEFNQMRQDLYDPQKQRQDEDLKRKKEIKKRNRLKHLTLKLQVEEFEKQEILLNHWMKISEKSGSFRILEPKEIFEHMNIMVSTLLESGKISEKANTTNLHLASSCLNLFLEKNMFEFFCSLVKNDMPKGIRAYTLQILCRFVSEIGIEVLSSEFISRPLLQLMEFISQAEVNDDVSVQHYVSLLSTLITQLTTMDVLDPLLNSSQSLVVLDQIQKYLDRSDAIGECARRSVLSLVVQAEAKVSKFIHNNGFSEHVVQNVISAYTDSVEAPAATVDELLLNLKIQLRFCSDIVKTETDTGRLLLSCIVDQFFHQAIGPSLLNEGKQTARATTFIRECMHCFDAPSLRGQLLEYLLGASEYESEARDEEELLRFALLRRIASPDSELSIATLQFFLVVLELSSDAFILHNIILRSLIPGLVTSLKLDKCRLDNVASTVSSYFSMWSGTEFGIWDYPSLQERALLRISTVQKQCRNWDSFNLSNEKIKGKFSTKDDKYLQQYPAGVFLHFLFHKLHQYFSNPVEVNHLLTRIFLQLLYFPVPVLYSLLLHKSQPLAVGYSSLHDTLTLLVNQVKEKAKDEDFESRVIEAKKRLEKLVLLNSIAAEDAKYFAISDDTQVLPDSVALLGGFCTELAATLAVRSTLVS